MLNICSKLLIRLIRESTYTRVKFHYLFFCFYFQSAGSLSGGSEDGAGQNLDYDNQAEDEYHRVSNTIF